MREHALACCQESIFSRQHAKSRLETAQKPKMPFNAKSERARASSSSASQRIDPLVGRSSPIVHSRKALGLVPLARFALDPFSGRVRTIERASERARARRRRRLRLLALYVPKCAPRLLTVALLLRLRARNISFYRIRALLSAGRSQYHARACTKLATSAKAD